MIDDCPNAAYGWHSVEVNRDGTCRWCGRKVAPKMPRPRFWTWSKIGSDLECAYERMWDPDWGSRAYDSDPG